MRYLISCPVRSQNRNLMYNFLVPVHFQFSMHLQNLQNKVGELDWVDVNHSMALGQVLISYNFGKQLIPNLVSSLGTVFVCQNNKR